MTCNLQSNNYKCQFVFHSDARKSQKGVASVMKACELREKDSWKLSKVMHENNSESDSSRNSEEDIDHSEMTAHGQSLLTDEPPVKKMKSDVSVS